jgi:hypothetical protein
VTIFSKVFSGRWSREKWSQYRMISSLPGFQDVYTNKEQAGHSSHAITDYKVTVSLRKAGYELNFHMAEHKKTSLYNMKPLHFPVQF